MCSYSYSPTACHNITVSFQYAWFENAKESHHSTAVRNRVLVYSKAKKPRSISMQLTDHHHDDDGVNVHARSKHVVVGTKEQASGKHMT